MQYREFGRTGVKVSEVGFGGWAIGGTAYGTVDKSESLRALARAEELGCNFVDTARMYGDSELVLGEFLAGRRDRWFVATKFSKRYKDVERTFDEQLRRLRTDWVDFYQLHWAPGKGEHELYETLYRLKRSGKARFVGVSLYTPKDVHYVLDRTEIDGFQIPLSLLDPDPFLLCRAKIREHTPAVIARSALKLGFLAGEFTRDTRFSDPNDERTKLAPERIAKLVDSAERFRFLEKEAGSMTNAAVRYPLAFPEVSTVIVGTHTTAQADDNFGAIPAATLSQESLATILALQNAMGVRSRRGRLLEIARRILRFGLP